MSDFYWFFRCDKNDFIFMLLRLFIIYNNIIIHLFGSFFFFFFLFHWLRSTVVVVVVFVVYFLLPLFSSIKFDQSATVDRLNVTWRDGGYGVLLRPFDFWTDLPRKKLTKRKHMESVDGYRSKQISVLWIETTNNFISSPNSLDLMMIWQKTINSSIHYKKKFILIVDIECESLFCFRFYSKLITRKINAIGEPLKCWRRINEEKKNCRFNANWNSKLLKEIKKNTFPVKRTNKQWTS